MTIISVKRDPITRHYTVELRLTEDEALDLARQIVAEAEVKTEITNETPPQEPI